jgi:GAF domain-containing protein
MVAPGGTDTWVGGPFDMAEEFAELARTMSAGGSIDDTLSRICATAVERLPCRCHAGVTVVDPRHRLSTRGATGPLPVEVDRWQYQTGQGPCLDVVRSVRMVAVADLEEDRRWPEFSARAVSETEVRSMMSFRLFTADRVLGGLNLYSEEPGTFTEEAEAARWGRVYASHAALALASARTQADLRAALESRETISVAIGLLMARQGVTRQEAFDILRRASQRMNVKLRDVAARIAGGDSSVLPGEV